MKMMSDEGKELHLLRYGGEKEHSIIARTSTQVM